MGSDPITLPEVTMPRRPKGSVPSLVHHKPSGRARVRINGRDYWLGKWGSPEAQIAYDRLITEFVARRRITDASPADSAATPGAYGTPAPTEPAIETNSEAPEALTVIELVNLYLDHCRTYYKSPDGKLTSTYGNALQAARALRPFDDTLAANFGPKRLGMIRDSEAARGRPRVGCNAILKHVRRVFQWAESEELVPRGTHNSLKTAEPLKKGRTIAPELPPVTPVDDAVIDATIPFLPEIIADMVRLQRLTGARPGEICGLRPGDVERTGETWVWRPAHHKNSWRDHERVIMIGPRAQEIIERYMLRDPKAYCFSPAESERNRSALRRLARKSPLTPSQRARKPKRNGRRRPRDHYDTAAYRHAITRAFEQLNKVRKCQDPNATTVEDWSPNQIRHTAGTDIRKTFGLEAAQVVLGHSSADVTQIYAERNQALAADVMRQIG